MRDMEKSNEQKENKGNIARKFLIPAACISAIIFFGTNLFLAILWGVKGLPDGCSGEASLLSTGIGIIGFAIATWTGLNISNIVSRKDMDEMQQDLKRNEEKLSKSQKDVNNLKLQVDEQGSTVDNYKEKLSQSHKDIEDLHAKIIGLSETTESEIKPFVKQSQEVLLQQFLVELERAQDDLIAQYFADKFRDVLKNENDISYAKLIEIEMINAQVALRHRSAYAPDETIIMLADKGIDRIDKLQNCFPVKDYLFYRKADFMFYKGYRDKDEIESAKDFSEAITILKRELGYDSFGKKLNNDRALAYWNNMLGEAYSKIVHYYTNIYKISGGLEKWKETDINISYCIGLAIQYCEKATQLMGSSVYWRNLGCAYDRKDRVLALQEGKAFVSVNSTHIIDAFLHSASKVMSNYGISNGSGLNAFSVLLMYYQRYLNDKVANREDVYLACKECAEHISNMYAYASIAKLDFPRHIPFQKLYAFSCHYVYQACELNIEINAARGKSLQYFAQEFKDTLNLLEIVDTESGKGDAFTAKLHTILEVMG